MLELKSLTFSMQLKSRVMVIMGFSLACMQVVIQGEQLDCSINCACCEGGQSTCGNGYGGKNICLKGCISTRYGYRCRNPCKGNCLTCEKSFGLDCYTCKDSFYDISNRCNKTCSKGCEGGGCKDNGTCECNENFKGPKCEACVSGKYGYDDLNSNCSKPCSVGCVNGTCFDDGACNCLSNFTGTLCTDCIPGLFGSRCDIVCYNKNCLCSSEFNCIDCKPGYFNISKNCISACSSGCDNICEDDGSCICKLHFTGVHCDVCESGYFGNDCSQECGKKDAQCIKFDRSGTVCYLCANGYYLNNDGNCTLCGENCLDGVCNAKNGECSLGCKSGHWSAKCESGCNTNCTACAHFSGVCEHCTSQEVLGLYCNMTCNTHCLERACDRDSGNCLNGCIKDYYGPQCDNRCSDTCKAVGNDTTCNDVGYCFNGCVDGYFGDDCKTEVAEASKARANLDTKSLLGGGIGVFIAGGITTLGVVFLLMMLRRKISERKAASDLLTDSSTVPNTSFTDPYEMLQTTKSEQKFNQVDNDEEEYERITMSH